MSNAQPVEETREAWRREGRWAGTSVESRIDVAPGTVFVWLSVLYFVSVLGLSSCKLLWLDELITLHIARLSGPSAIWAALARGADPNPPGTHILVHACRALFGEREFALRLPAMVGYWVGLFCLFQYLRRRLPGTWAIGGVLLSMTMAAFEYSYESRSYGIFYGLAMMAFYCWSRAVDGRASRTARTIALIGMVFALAAGISTNYFAVLAFLPIAIGEATRTVRVAGDRGLSVRALLSALDLRIWMGIAVALTPLLAYRPLIERSIAQFAPYAWNKVSLGQVTDSYTEMVETVLWPILALFVLSATVYFVGQQIAPMCTACRMRVLPGWVKPLVGRPLPRLAIPVHEAAGVLGLMAYPFLGYIIASIRGGMLSPRFVIPVCFGFAIAATLLAFQLFGRLRHGGLVFVCFLLAWFLSRESVIGYWYEEQTQCFYKVLDDLPEAESAVPAGAPIVLPDPLFALTFCHYAPKEVASRVVFPVDFPAVRKFRGDDSPEENLWAGRDLLYELKVEPLADFENSAHQYLMIAGDGNWMLQDLAHHHFKTTRLPINTRAAAIGGFTPLARGVPAFYTASWDEEPTRVRQVTPIPFKATDNLPSAKPADDNGGDEE